MPVYKDKNGTWYVMTRCDDWQRQRKQKAFLLLLVMKMPFCTGILCKNYMMR
jgi:hypothetical protein